MLDYQRVKYNSQMRTMVLEYLPTFTQKLPSFVGKYTSTMEHLGFLCDDDWKQQTICDLRWILLFLRFWGDWNSHFIEFKQMMQMYWTNPQLYIGIWPVNAGYGYVRKWGILYLKTWFFLVENMMIYHGPVASGVIKHDWLENRHTRPGKLSQFANLKTVIYRYL